MYARIEVHPKYARYKPTDLSQTDVPFGKWPEYSIYGVVIRDTDMSLHYILRDDDERLDIWPATMFTTSQHILRDEEKNGNR